MTGAMREVELVEDDAPADRPDSVERAARTRRRVPRWAWATAGVLVVAAAGAQLAVDAYERALDARYATTPGFVERLTPPLRVAWRASDGEPSAWPAAVVGTTGVTAVIGRNGSISVVARDLRDGRRLWRAPLRGADPARASSPTNLSLDVVEPARCVAVQPSGGAAPTRLACLTTDDRTFVADTSTGGVVQRQVGTSADIRVLDLATGRTVSTLRTGAAESLDVVGSQLVLAHLELDGTADVRVVDLTGGERWHARTASPSGSDPGIAPAAVWRVADEVVVRDGNRALTRFALADGTVVAPAETATDVVVADARDRAWLTGIPSTADGLTTSGTLVLGTGRDVTVPGRVVPVVADDGSAPGLLLAVDGAGRVHGYDATTGHPRWAGLAQLGESAVVLDGRVYAVGDSAVVSAVDAQTGRTVWSTGSLSTAASRGSLLSDGYHLFVGATDASGQKPELVALDKHTGEVAWRAELPGEGGFPTAVAHLAVVLGDPSERYTS